MSKLIINIKELLQIRDKGVSFISAKEMDKLPSINNAYLLIENGKISEFGKMSEISKIENVETIDAKNKIVLPCWCDSHTHSVYTGNRSDEYLQRIKGVSYQEIANRAGLTSSSRVSSYLQSELRWDDLLKYSKLSR